MSPSVSRTFGPNMYGPRIFGLQDFRRLNSYEHLNRKIGSKRQTICDVSIKNKIDSEELMGVANRDENDAIWCERLLAKGGVDLRRNEICWMDLEDDMYTTRVATQKLKPVDDVATDLRSKPILVGGSIKGTVLTAGVIQMHDLLGLYTEHLTQIQPALVLLRETEWAGIDDVEICAQDVSESFKVWVDVATSSMTVAEVVAGAVRHEQSSRSFDLFNLKTPQILRRRPGKNLSTRRVSPDSRYGSSGFCGAMWISKERWRACRDMIAKYCWFSSLRSESKTKHFKRIQDGANTHTRTRYDLLLSGLHVYFDNEFASDLSKEDVLVRHTDPGGLTWEQYEQGIKVWCAEHDVKPVTPPPGNENVLEIAHFNDIYQAAVMNALNVEISVAGNHEFDFGYRRLAELISDTNLPWLLSNIIDTDAGAVPEPLKAFHVIEKGES
ncbi:uncharacterized protein F5891DRAFT_985319 [Suillus fuscotomentosus]|uniref:Uncharacterized protein n=1 Tax=Suillus fuscotomentosus TaxID=1912939 RepID=A0AAD4HFA7_9AGAM|nr:uncharacterized protein F5891DRAFT_985319 [Suillus fuscotomentosus]KAG1894071.1 hypothetical protein F5891DRAFT_985319 [Suillus fuscotomentosus]